MQNLKRSLLSSLLVIGMAAVGRSIDMTGGDFEMTKDLAGVPGSAAISSSDYSLAFAGGEELAGGQLAEQPFQLTSGYYGGRFGNAQSFRIQSSQIGLPTAKTFFQDQLQVGVAFDAPIQLTFSDPLDISTLPGSIQVVAATDHLGNPSNTGAPVTVDSDALNQVVTILPQTAWTGNTLYDVQVTPKLQNIDGVPLDEITHLYYVTLLDHHQENVVIHPFTAPGLPAAIGNGAVEAMSIHIPAQSLSNYSTVLTSRDPLNTPLRVNPKLIQEANAKARAAGGAYRVPLAVQEINAYNTNGDLMGPLSAPAEISMDYGGSITAPAEASGLIRPRTLALYVLDETHGLWVKIPESQNALGFHTVGAPVTQFSVFALMGSADGSASDSSVFPVPWRPHGPLAGNGPGQTGTESEGLTFTNLPSECTIRIFTIAGDLVREIQHSDTGGTPHQEKWDAKTTHGETVASEVYLWRVQSSVDSKNGKLMIIR